MIPEQTDENDEPRRSKPPARTWALRIGATALIFAAGAACQATRAEDCPKPKTKTRTVPGPTVTVTPTPEKMTTVIGKTVQEAEQRADRAGYTVRAHDASDKDGDVGDFWTICFEKVTGFDKVAVGAVPNGAPCPHKDGQPIPWPKVPSVVGSTYKDAIKALKGATVESVDADEAYEDDDVVDLGDGEYNGWMVCFQDEKPGRLIKTQDLDVVLSLAKGSCPSHKGTYRDPKNDPDYVPPGYGDDDGDDGYGGGTTGGDSYNPGGCPPGGCDNSRHCPPGGCKS
ncbi:hypothetical protein [Streptomyces sp. NPDC101150]|uniref:hypothetical protein n=1 Tax=Streptomyces sp. NPDC101150 TaxID=3366114 RepID=UPI0038070A4E